MKIIKTTKRTKKTRRRNGRGKPKKINFLIDKRKENKVDRMAIINKIKKNMKVEVFDN